MIESKHCKMFILLMGLSLPTGKIYSVNPTFEKIEYFTRGLALGASGLWVVPSLLGQALMHVIDHQRRPFILRPFIYGTGTGMIASIILAKKAYDLLRR